LPELLHVGICGIGCGELAELNLRHAALCGFHDELVVALLAMPAALSFAIFAGSPAGVGVWATVSPEKISAPAVAASPAVR